MEYGRLIPESAFGVCVWMTLESQRPIGIVLVAGVTF